MKRIAVVSCCIALLGSANAYAVTGTSSGTKLSVTGVEFSSACTSSTEATVTVSFTLVSTGAVDAASWAVLQDGLTPLATGVVLSGITPSGGWTSAGRMKTADVTTSFTLTNGSYTLNVCAEQHGTQTKSDCSQPVTITIDCSVGPTTACGGIAFGEIVGNSNICRAENSDVNVNFKGDFGTSGTLTISGPSYDSGAIAVPVSGASCVYTYNWDKPALIDGEYTFTMTGNGHTASTAATCTNR